VTSEATRPAPVFQVGYVVPDLEAARDYFETRLGIGPWRTTPRPPVVDRTYRGTPTPDAYEAASFAFVGDLQIEIMQPVVGPSIYQDFLEEHPQGGVHRIAILVDDYEAGVEALGGPGEIAQSGRVNDFRFAFFDAPALGNFIEVVYLDEAAKAMLATFREGDAGS
jgi:catechol 2,3-dioxygenase-like lactoylglutathione lyase family enzyme